MPELFRRFRSNYIASEDWNMTWATLTPDAALIERATELTRDKYAVSGHNRRR